MKHYYRCQDCLSVMVLEDRQRNLVCSCGGKVDWLGEVRKSRLTSTRVVPACDGRCTHAKGPECNCMCGGANHGSGAVVQIIRDEGPIPIMVPLDEQEAKERAYEYKTALRLAEEYLTLSFGQVWTEWKAGAWVNNRQLWSQMNWYDYKLNQIKKMKRHADRISKLADFTSQAITPAK